LKGGVRVKPPQYLYWKDWHVLLNSLYKNTDFVYLLPLRKNPPPPFLLKPWLKPLNAPVFAEAQAGRTLIWEESLAEFSSQA
jgi:hypothetical protein